MSQSKSQLKLDWASHEAAEYACKHWHYSGCLPRAGLVKIGAWEDSKFIGCVIFSRGANNHLLVPYGLKQTEGCELTRIALTTHTSPVSRIMSIAMRLLQRQSPGMRLIISFADPLQSHHGGIYQACNWVYVGSSQAQREVMYQGKVMHKRTAHDKWGTIKGLEKSPVLWKHKYLMPLDDEIRQRILPLSKPYPKKPRATSIEGDASSVPTGRGGINATVALHEVTHVR